MPKMRESIGGENAHRFLPVFLGVSELQRSNKTSKRRLLRILFIWGYPMSAYSRE
jgi:hypothetical protein